MDEEGKSLSWWGERCMALTQKKSLEQNALRIAPCLLDPYGGYPVSSRTGSPNGIRQVFWLTDHLLSGPSHLEKTVVLPDFVPVYSGGTAPDSHGIPY